MFDEADLDQPPKAGKTQFLEPGMKITTPPPLTVLAIGSRVFVGGSSKVDGIIRSIRIEPGRIYYEVSYWDGLTNLQAWLESCEFKIHAAQPQPIGFVSSLPECILPRDPPPCSPRR